MSARRSDAAITGEEAADILGKLGACAGARRWVSRQKTWQAAWDRCERIDWFVWIIIAVCGAGDALHRSRETCTCRCIEHWAGGRGDDCYTAVRAVRNRWPNAPDLHAVLAAWTRAF